MRIRGMVAIAAMVALLATQAVVAKEKPLEVTTQQVPGLTRMLESQPRHAHAPVIRALLIDWEDKTKDVVDYVCPGLLKPAVDPGTPNGPQLLAQYIFGSAAWQIENPADRGVLQPSQLAGMRSLLKAYAAFLADDPGARIARFDELAAMEAAGTLPGYLAPLVATECGDAGKSS